MSGMPGHVTVCIVGFRNHEDIVRCLSALSRQSHGDFDVVLCENGGAQAYADLHRAVPAQLPSGQRVEIVSAPDNPGYAGGVNLCMKARPDSDGWWIVNPDTEPQPGALEALLRRINEGYDAAGGTLYHPDGKVQAYGGRWRYWLARAESIGIGGAVADKPDPAAIEARMNYILGASMLVSRPFVERTGLMREEYFLYCEEVEWGLRAVRLGLRLGFAPDALVLHGQGGTTGSADPLRSRPRLPVYMDERNKLNVVRDVTPARLPVAAVAALGLLTLRYAAKGAWPQWGYALSGWWAGLRGQRGKPKWLG